MYEPIDLTEARKLLDVEGTDFYELMARAGRVREHYKENIVKFCSITNAKSGKCPEDCGFCAQSSRYKNASSPKYSLQSADTIINAAKEAEKFGASEFSIVTSGRTMNSGPELDTVKEAISNINEKTNLYTCVSLGLLGKKELEELKKAGLSRVHHNLETSRSFFPNVVTTHSYDDEINTIKLAKEMGFYVCSGGIFGMGEDKDQRIELMKDLRELEVDSVPVNFLNPRPGTPMEGKNELSPKDCLKILAVLRLMMPEIDMFVCGGREVNLRDMQSWIFMAGANGVMLGNYLTTKGRDAEEDLQMIHDLGLVSVRDIELVTAESSHSITSKTSDASIAL